MLTYLLPLFTCVPDVQVPAFEPRLGPCVVYVADAVGVGAVGVGAVGVGAVGVGAVGVGAVGVGAVGVGVLHPSPV